MSRRVARARALLSRPGGWIDGAGVDGVYCLRLGIDRRSRAALTIDETAFRALLAVPGLRARPGGGWVARSERQATSAAPVGAPGRIEGARWVMDPDGRPVGRRANLGESPIGWLARRKDPAGRPWLTTAEIAAGERLRLDAETARVGQALTMRWDSFPRAARCSPGTPFEPRDRALAASRRAAEALAACDPAARAFVEQICVRSQSLGLAEQLCGLRRREGKAILKRGLAALAHHYGIG